MISRLLPLILICALTRLGLAEQPTDSLTDRLVTDATDGRFDDFTLWQAATIAGGGGAKRLAALSGGFDSLLRRAVDGDDREASDERRARRLFELMHEEVLKGEYQSDLNDFATSFSGGSYNCVTATVLYQGLCRACGLAPRAVAAPAHVYTRLKTESVLNIETTCPGWFRLNRERAKPSPAGRELSDVQLVGKIFYNRGVRLLDQQRFAAALEQLEVSLVFDPHDQTAKDNRLAAINNWALSRCKAERYADAVKLLERGMRIRSDYPPFLANDLHIHQKWAQHLCRDNRYLPAIRLLNERRLVRPSESLFDKGRVSIYQDWLTELLASGDHETATGQLREAGALLDDCPEIDAWREELLRSRERNLRSQGRGQDADRMAAWARDLRGSARPGAGHSL